MPKIQYLHKTRQGIPDIYAQMFGDILQNMNFSRYYRNRGKFIYGFDPNIIENGVIKESRVVNSNGAGHGALAGFLKNEGVDVLICGGIGAGAQTALANAGIRLYGGVSGSADEAADAFLEDRLEYDANVKCSHHHHHEGGCGEHTCSH